MIRTSHVYKKIPFHCIAGIQIDEKNKANIYEYSTSKKDHRLAARISKSGDLAVFCLTNLNRNNGDTNGKKLLLKQIGKGQNKTVFQFAFEFPRQRIDHAFSDDESLLVFNETDQRIVVYDLKTNQKKYLTIPATTVLQIKFLFSPNKKTLAVIWVDNAFKTFLCTFDIESGEKVQSRELPFTVYCIWCRSFEESMLVSYFVTENWIVMCHLPDYLFSFYNVMTNCLKQEKSHGNVHVFDDLLMLHSFETIYFYTIKQNDHTISLVEIFRCKRQSLPFFKYNSGSLPFFHPSSMVHSSPKKTCFFLQTFNDLIKVDLWKSACDEIMNFFLPLLRSQVSNATIILLLAKRMPINATIERRLHKFLTIARRSIN